MDDDKQRATDNDRQINSNSNSIAKFIVNSIVSIELDRAHSQPI
jgi:hypothetical protein